MRGIDICTCGHMAQTHTLINPDDTLACTAVDANDYVCNCPRFVPDPQPRGQVTLSPGRVEKLLAEKEAYERACVEFVERLAAAGDDNGVRINWHARELMREFGRGK